MPVPNAERRLDPPLSSGDQPPSPALASRIARSPVPDVLDELHER